MGKKSLGLLLLSALLVLATACGGATEEKDAGGKNEDAFSAGLVTDVGGINDESFNQIAWAGLENLEKDIGAKVSYLESKRDSDYVPNLTKFVRDNTDITWGIGFKFEKALPEVAKRFPDAKLGIVDSDLGGDIPENVSAVLFKEEEGSFLLGVIAAKMTKTKQVGFIGGISSPVIKRFESGFRAGVHAVDPDIKVVVAYAESFTDVAKGRSLAKNMYDGGADIIYHAAGGVGKGLFSEVKTREQGKYWAMGVDMDQSSLAPDHTLTSMIKRVDVAVYDISKRLKNGDWQGGKVINLGLKENGVGIADNTDKHVPKEILDEVEKYKQEIIDGKIKVPGTEAELKEFLEK